MADCDVDPEQHERVAKALEQVNGLKYRYYAQPKEAKKVLNFHSDDSDSDGESRAHIRRASKTHGGGGSGPHGDNDDEECNEDEEDVDAGLSFDDHIDRILRKTRTIALLKIANNTAEILPEDDLDDDFEDDEDAFDFDDNAFSDNDDVDSTETEDRFNKDDDHALRTNASSPSLRDQKSFRRGNSMRSTTNSVHSTSSKTSSGGGTGSGGGSRRDHDEALAAMRLVRTLSSFLSLPRVISYKDLEMITETLLNEPSGSHDDYGDLIDFHVDSARDSSSAGEDGGTAAADDPPIWKRRNTNTIQSLTLPDDPGDLELHQRRMFMEANRFNRFSSKNFFSASSKNMMSSKTSMRRLESPTSLSGSFRNNSDSPSDAMLAKKDSKHSGSFRSTTGSVAEELEDEKRGDDAASNGDGNGEDDPRAGPFDEEEYLKWRTEVKAEYLAWLQAKLEAKRKRRETLKKEAGKKPRWLLLYEASKRPEPKEPKK